jgi:hypothetical protein
LNTKSNSDSLTDLRNLRQRAARAWSLRMDTR